MREYLKKLRTDRGMTMQEVADSFGISKQYYEMIESGERQKKMEITLVLKISSLFGLSVEKIVELESEIMNSAEEKEETENERTENL